MGRDENAAEAFELIGHSDRLSIVEVLIEARQDDGENDVRFTDLRDQSNIDDTGRFNYHLDQLLGTFVTKTDAGYRLSSYAHRIMAPMMGGIYDPNRAAESIETAGECPECRGNLKIQPDDTVLRVVCERDHVLNKGLLGYPGVVDDRPPADAAETLSLINMQGTELAVAGICPACHGPVDGEISAAENADQYYFEAPCRNCGNQFANTVGSCVLRDPTVVSFLHDHGIDIRRTLPWSLPFVYPGSETVESTDPLRLSVEIRVDEKSLTVTVSQNGSTISTKRT